MRKVFLAIIFSLVFFYSSLSFVQASFGVSPADLTFRSLIPGTTVERSFLLSRTDLEKEDTIIIQTDVKGVDGWITIEPGTAFTIPEGERTKRMMKHFQDYVKSYTDNND